MTTYFCVVRSKEDHVGLENILGYNHRPWYGWYPKSRAMDVDLSIDIYISDPSMSVLCLCILSVCLHTIQTKDTRNIIRTSVIVLGSIVVCSCLIDMIQIRRKAFPRHRLRAYWNSRRRVIMRVAVVSTPSWRVITRFKKSMQAPRRQCILSRKISMLIMTGTNGICAVAHLRSLISAMYVLNRYGCIDVEGTWWVWVCVLRRTSFHRTTCTRITIYLYQTDNYLSISKGWLSIDIQRITVIINASLLDPMKGCTPFC